jgi:hypothetical protein
MSLFAASSTTVTQQDSSAMVNVETATAVARHCPGSYENTVSIYPGCPTAHVTVAAAADATASTKKDMKKKRQMERTESEIKGKEKRSGLESFL